MGLEIERRFLVKGDGWRSSSRWQVRLRQGYLVSGQDGLVLRVRIAERPLAQHGERAGFRLADPESAATVRG